jgi:hypothetical protein
MWRKQKRNTNIRQGRLVYGRIDSPPHASSERASLKPPEAMMPRFLKILREFSAAVGNFFLEGGVRPPNPKEP